MDSSTFLRDLLLNEELSDVRVIVENKMEKANFPAHSLVLKRRSPVIAKMLESGFVEGQNQTILITDFKIIHVEMFLKFLYTDILPESYTGLCKLVKIADKYLVSQLKERCEESLIPFVSIQNVYELCRLADTFSLKKLLDRCLFLIKRAAFKLLQRDDLKILSKEILEHVVRADDLNVMKEIDVFLAIWRCNLQLRGVHFSKETVKELIEDLLKHVRWSLIAQDEQEEIKSLGITIADADLQIECQPRQSSTMDIPWFLRQCDVLRVDENASSYTIHNSPLLNQQVMHAMSLNDQAVYVVGVSFTAYTKEPCIQATLECSCESSRSMLQNALRR